MPGMNPQAQDAAQRFVFFILLMFFFTASPTPGPLPNAGPGGFGLTPRDALKASIARQHRALDVLNETSWGDWKYDAGIENDGGAKELNLTGFRDGDGYLWGSVWGDVKTRVGGMRERLWQGKDEKTMAVYTNITGQVLGDWVRSDIGLGGDKGWERPGNMTLNLTTIEPEVGWGWGRWDRNVTGKSGAMNLVIKEKDQEGNSMLYGEPGKEQLIRMVDFSLTVEDESHGGEGWEMRLHGVHWPAEGTLILTTTSDKFAGIYGLPHLALTEDHFSGSQKLLNKTLATALEKREKVTWGIPQDPYNSDDDGMSPHCEYVVYGQVHPVSMVDFYSTPTPKIPDDLQGEITALENELRFPNGAPIGKPPPLAITLVAFSPDCGFVLESKGPPAYTPVEGKHLQGLKQEVYVKHIKHWALVWAVVLVCQVALLRRQMKEASTPSTISRISLYTAGIMAASDFVVVGALMLLAISAPMVFPTATLTAFTACLSMGLGVRFLAEVYNVQEPERREANRVRDIQLAEELAAFRARRDAFLASHRRAMDAAAAARAAAIDGATPVVITAAGADVVPSTAPAPEPPTVPEPTPDPDPPIIIPSDQDIDAEIAEVDPTPPAPTPAATTLPITNPQLLEAVRLSRGQDIAASYGQFMMVLMCFFFLTISSPAWPTILRRIYFNVVGISYFSFWWPQIYRNAIRNCRKAFQWRFVAGQSLLRLLPWAYFYLKEDNVLFATRSLFGITLLAGWLWIQILVLVAMDVLGPRFALPKGWLPEAWDYHPLLREDDVEGGGLPLGLVRTPGSPRLERRRSTSDDSRAKKSDDSSMSVDCAICMQKLDVPVLAKGEENSKAVGVTGLLARRMYMVTPCRHVFHSQCLEGWMKYRLQCPICRENLPPL